MQTVTQTHSEGLRHEYKIVVPVSDLDARVDSRVSELKNTVQLKGFRPGKVLPKQLATDERFTSAPSS